VQRVAQREQQPLGLDEPRRVARDRGRELTRREPGRRGEEPDMYAPLVLRPAQVRKITSSRARNEIAPRSSSPPIRTRRSTRGLWASVRNSASGGTPGGISLVRSSSTVAGYGGAQGGIRLMLRIV
jgi:hypothetical protein